MANTESIRQKSSQEAEIDHLLAEEFCCDPRFSACFAAACGLRFETFRVRKAVPEFSLGGEGYGDLLVKAEMDGQRAAVLIEDKITASAPPRQAACYAAHAERLRLEGWDSVVTVLVAPSTYRGERDQYDASIDLEAVADMLDSPDPLRRDYRRKIIARALEKKAATDVANPDPAVHRLHADYLNWIGDRCAEQARPYEFPQIKRAYYDRDSWVYKIRHPDFPDHVWLRHRLWTSETDPTATGMVDLIVSPTPAGERERLEVSAPEGATVDHYGKEQDTQVSLRVPKMHPSTGFSETAAAEAFAAMDLLTGFFLRLDKG